MTTDTTVDPASSLQPAAYTDKTGAFKRKPSQFRDWISSEPNAKFPPELNRYHLYVSYTCPWAHRTLITRALKGLTGVISVSIVHWLLDDKGWKFTNSEESVSFALKNKDSLGTEDHLYGYDRLRQLYFKAEPEYAGRFTVPVLWDKKLQTIVNNESSEIIRMLSNEFNAFIPKQFAEINIYPVSLQPRINELNELIYENINNGVYKSGFAIQQDPYDEAVTTLFEHLDKVEEIFKQNHNKGEHFLIGGQLTEADIRLYVTIVRFDLVYHQHFKCNLKMIRYDYPHIDQWLRYLYWKVPGFEETTELELIKTSYTTSHTQINPYGITPKGPLPLILPYDSSL
ncbi:glutathione S-transferase [Scheffersomyces coipomensis]|uniref:glutathione S-transferase n=1 Tax=Scheffersomyces coipomensis TaxID=1788519 RepID=UPI00315C91CF